MRARDLSIRVKLLLLVGLFAVGFAAFITVVSLEMKPKLEDSDYNDVVTMKDVLADVLPPPKYIIEPYLVLLQLDSQEDAAAREALIRVLVIAGCAVFGAVVARSLAHRIEDTVVALNAIASGDFGRRRTLDGSCATSRAPPTSSQNSPTHRAIPHLR